MTTSSPTSGAYHHGDLRCALLDAAMGLVEERGVHGLTLREVARRAGVSHNAPYHHFADKAAVVEALALEGYEMLLADELAAIDPSDAIYDRIRALGRAYIGFAVANPARFTVMNRPELRRAGQVTEVHAAGMASEGPLFAAIDEGQADGSIAPGDREALALGAWAAVHGLSVLLVDGPLRELGPRGSALVPMIDQVLDVILDGLATRPSSPR
ncbi:MAG: TetR/AcrR family transcriptional regulator [Actinomycetota bacterium]